MVFRFGRPSPVLYDRLMVDVVWARRPLKNVFTGVIAVRFQIPSPPLTLQALC
jgi:hypothetical protein